MIAHHKIGHIPTTTMTSSTTIIYSTDYAQNIINSKVLLIDIVGHADNREASLIVEDIQARSDIVFIIKPILRRKLSEHPVIHSTTGYQINCLVSFTIIDTTKFRLVTQLIKHLYLINSFCWKVFDCSGHIASKKLFAINQNFLYRFTLCSHGTILNANTRHFFQQVLGHSILCHFIRI